MLPIQAVITRGGSNLINFVVITLTAKLFWQPVCLIIYAR